MDRDGRRACQRTPAYLVEGRRYCGGHARDAGEIEGRLLPARRSFYGGRGARQGWEPDWIDSYDIPGRSNGTMPVFTGTQKSAGPDIEDGSYECVIVETEQEEGNYGPQVRVQFRIAPGEDSEGEEFRSWYTIPTNKKGEVQPIRVGTKLGDLFSAALFSGEPYPEGTDLDTDDLDRKRVRVLWGEYTTKAGLKKSGVLGVKASKKAKRPAAVAGVNGSLKKRLVDDDDADEDDLADA